MEQVINAARKLLMLNDKLYNIKESISKISGVNIKSQDARILAIDSMQADIQTSVMWFMTFNKLRSQYVNKENEFLSSISSAFNMKTTQDIMIRQIRLAFVTLVHSRIENLFYNLLRHFRLLPSHPSFNQLSNAILVKCELSNNGYEKKCLKALANLRNCLHNNGIHRNANLNLSIIDTLFESNVGKPVVFDFIENKIVVCVSWHHIVVLLNSNIEILKELFLFNDISSINAEISDDYATQFLSRS